MPPSRPREVHRRQQLLRGQDVPAARLRCRAAGGEPGGVERRLASGESQGGVRQERRRRHRLLTAGRDRHDVGSNAIMESGVLQDIAAKRGKTIAQVNKNLKAKGGKIRLARFLLFVCR